MHKSVKSASTQEFLLIPSSEYEQLLRNKDTVVRRRSVLQQIRKEIYKIIHLKNKSPELIQKYLDIRLRQLRKRLDNITVTVSFDFVVVVDVGLTFYNNNNFFCFVFR